MNNFSGWDIEAEVARVRLGDGQVTDAQANIMNPINMTNL
jgi:hypothetical protein